MNQSFMPIIVVLLVLVIIAVVGIVMWTVNKTRGQETNSMALMQQQLEGLREQLRLGLEGNVQVINQQLGQVTGSLNERLKESTEVLERVNKGVGERLDNAARVVGDVQRKLGQVEEANKRIYDIGKEIASLQEILRAPKLRGILGELFLGDLLSQILPASHFKLQHQFKTGDRVDAVIVVGDNLVPVDSKFPLENFKRCVEAVEESERKSARKQFLKDVTKHIDNIAAKYILPDEGTFDFALMYIPAENIYYEIIIKDEGPTEGKEIFQYSTDRKVIPVSPNSFYAYLQVILLGLKGLKIEDKAKEIFGKLARVNTDFDKFKEDFALIGTHLSRSKNSYENAEKRLIRFGDSLDGIASLEEEKEKRLLP
ncbi:MAG: DNA recombination protein RmuC [Thermodesulfobacteriota bacterium]